MNSDFKDALGCLLDENVRFLVVGGYAVIHYTEPRFTKDLGLWLDPSVENARRIVRAFHTFGVPLIEITEDDLSVAGTQFMIGIPPNAIDFITTCSHLVFAPCWEQRQIVEIDGLLVPYLSRDDLVEAKKFFAREQDKVDLRKLLLCP